MAVVTSSEVVNTGYAVLALIADAIVLFTLIFFLVSRGSGSARERWGHFRDAVTPYALQVAWIAAVLATFGSLFLQYEEGLQPCDFCWFQRICMYPLSLLLGIAAFRGNVQVAKRYFLGLSMVGAVIAIYHYQLEHVTGEKSVCSLVPGAVPCNVSVINIFGFISVPFLSMAAFLLITTLILVARGSNEDYEDEEEIDVIEAGVETDPGDDALAAPA
jgi:disulfide bond formation protein DsbB